MLSVLALVVLSPVILAVMIVLKLTGEHSILYVQERIGKGATPFKLFKFVTMVKDSSNIGTGTITIRNDPRVLQFGRILRRTKVNELPQLINIIKGDMSIIGPRPLPRENYRYYSDEVRTVFSKMRPGLSGVGSIVFRDEGTIMENIGGPYEKCYREHIAPYKGQLERWYAEHQSLGLDIRLILLTLLVVLRPRMNVSTYLKELPPEPRAFRRKAADVADMACPRENVPVRVRGYPIE
jgi:lipopolysaccharide/colanic/teichoic acid biosynthesis glycosyltransferase